MSRRVVGRAPLTRQWCVDCGVLLPKSGHPRERCRACWEQFRPEHYRRLFWSKVNRTGGPDACWPWLGRLNRDGYGEERAHRRAYGYANGPIPRDAVVRHTCDNPPCCNPRHLLTGTQADNVADRVARGRSATGERSGAHTKPSSVRRGSRHSQARLTEADVERIRVRLANGEVHREIARDYGVARTTVTAIRRAQNWRHQPSQAA